MRKFMALKPTGLPEGFDIASEGELPLVKVEESKNKIIVSYAFPGFYLVETSARIKGEKSRFERPHISAVGFLADSGKPLLPAFNRYVSVPSNCSCKLTVKKEHKIEFENVLIAPAQEKLSDTIGIRENAFEYDKKFYAKDEMYPKEIVETKGPIEIEGYNAILLSVRPLQYNPAKRKLVGYGNITVIIDITPGTGAKEVQPDNSEPINLELVKLENKAIGNLFLNPTLYTRERLVGKPYLFGPYFLIIYGDAFKSAATKLALWKNMCGLWTEIVPISTIGNDVDKIKKYIRSRYSIFGGLHYVLLLGDVDTIVTQEYTGWLSYLFTPRRTDFYYSTKNNKEDARPVGAPGYLLPRIAVGRIPVSTAKEASTVVDKIIKYEKNPPAVSGYFDHFTLAAFFQDNVVCSTCGREYRPPAPLHCSNCGGTSYNPQDGQENRAFIETIQGIFDFFDSDPNYTVDRVYVSNNNGNENFYYSGAAIPASVRAAFTTSSSTATTALKNATIAGRHFVGHRDHGGIDGWGDPEFKNSDLATITSKIPSIFYSVNCITGAFAESTDCFAETLLKMSNGGAPSLLASSDLSNTWLNNDFIFGLFDATFGGLLSVFPGAATSYSVQNNRIGDIMNYAKYYLPIARSHGATDDDIVINFEEYHVIGDPTLEIWTEAPLKIRLKARFFARKLIITLSACPPGSKITIWKGKTLLKRISPTSRRIVISVRGITSEELRPVGRESLFDLTLRDVVVCFKAPGYRFARVRVTA